MGEEGRHMFSAGHCCLVAKSQLTLYETPRAVARPSPLSMSPLDFPGKNTGVGCHFLLQGPCPTQGSNLCLLHWQVDSLPLSPQVRPGGTLRTIPPCLARGLLSAQGAEVVSWRERSLTAGFWLPKPGRLSAGDLGG